ncbi:MAG TPA: hypothetical protein VK453_25385 [Micromonosporaceae bacterium]|nr:hypothetical protein [Micromonosporaceae bacterium]
MALIWSVYAVTEDRMRPDLDRMNRVVDVDPQVARMRLNDGTARKPTDAEVAEFEERHAVELRADEALDAGDLASLKKPELEEMAAALEVEVAPGDTKAVIAASIEEQRAKTQAEAGKGGVATTSATANATGQAGPAQPTK